MKRLHRRISGSFRGIIETAENLYRRLLLKLSRSVYYIGGSDVLPPPLPPNEEEKMLKAYAAGDMNARSILIEHNLRLVVYIAKKFENAGVNVEDLISIGTIGLIKAVNTFKLDKNIKLATYASRCIENEILMYLRRNTRLKSEVSLDEPLNVDWDGNELLLSDILGTENDVVSQHIEEEVNRKLLYSAMNKLEPRERELMEMRFGLKSGREMTQKEVEDYYNSVKVANDPTPISHGLNAKVVKKNGKVVEQVYKVGGLYGEAIEKIVYNLNKALQYAESDKQRTYIRALIDYYTTGDLKKFDEYSILWAEDTNCVVDFINGFIESYDDPLGMTGAWESIVNFKNQEASHRTQVISENAQWFEDNSPVDARFKKKEVKGVSAKVITAAILAGDAYPATPIGINLPNADWIRAAHVSKSAFGRLMPIGVAG